MPGDNGPMASTLIVLAAAAAGWVVWTFTEYAVHRWVFHHHPRRRVRTLAAWEHTRHHRAPLHTSLPLRLAGHVGVAALGLPVALTVAWLVSPSVGFGGWAGWAVGYVVYEVAHWRLHHRAPRSRRGLLARRHHYLHHGVDAATNFGVTVDWWDRAFATLTPSATVTVPEAHAAPWLLSAADEHTGIDVRVR